MNPFKDNIIQVKAEASTEIKKEKKKGGLKELLALLDSLYELQTAIEACIDAGTETEELKTFDENVDAMLEKVVEMTKNGIQGIRTRNNDQEGEDTKKDDISTGATGESSEIILDDIPVQGTIRNTSAPVAPFPPRV